MTTRKEMVPAVRRSGKGTMYLCKPEWDLLCWIRRELRLIERKDAKDRTLTTIAQIVSTMNETFTDWPEDPK